MESEDRLEGLTESEESSSEAGSWAGSEEEAAVVTPAAAQHNYNLRTKRVAPGTTEEPALAKKSDIAPGVGVEADQHIVGGRDASEPTEKRGIEREAADTARERVRVGSAPVETGARVIRDPPPQVVDRSGGVAWSIPVLRARGRPRPPDRPTKERSSEARRRGAATRASAATRRRERGPGTLRRGAATSRREKSGTRSVGRGWPGDRAGRPRRTRFSRPTNSPDRETLPVPRMRDGRRRADASPAHPTCSDRRP